MGPKRRKAPRMGVRQPNPEHVKCLRHLQWVRGFPCLAAPSGGCVGPVQTHHVSHDRDRDDRVVPLCVQHHTEVHASPEKFQAKYLVNLDAHADVLWGQSPHGRRYRKENET